MSTFDILMTTFGFSGWAFAMICLHRWGVALRRYAELAVTVDKLLEELP